MTNLATRESIFGDLSDFRHEFEELFGRLLRGSPWGIERVAQLLPDAPPIESWLDKEKKTTTPELLCPELIRKTCN